MPPRKKPSPPAALLLLLALPAAAPAQPAQTVRSGAEARTALAVTAYHSGPAAFRETRGIDLPDGEARLLLQGVPEGLDLGSLRLDSRHRAEVRNASFTPGDLDTEALLRAHIGAAVRLRGPNGEATRVQQARLLAYDSERLLLRLDDGVRALPRSAAERLTFPQPPADRHARPTAALTLDVGRDGREAVRIAYRAGGLGWQPRYQLETAPGRETATLRALAEVTNRTGVDLPGAELTLIAARLGTEPGPRALAAAPERAQAASAPIAGFPRYRLEGRHDLTAGRRHRLPLFRQEGLDARRYHRATGDAGAEPHGAERPAVTRMVEWTAGRDLPGGDLDLYRREDDGSTWLGSGRLPPTPEGEPVAVALGPSFAVTARRELQARRALEGAEGFIAQWAIRLRNGAERATTVTLRERFPSRWRLLGASDSPAERSARRAEWRLRLEAGGTRTLTYRARVETP